MKGVSDREEKLKELYSLYMEFLCNYELGHGYSEKDWPWYHQNDFETNLKEEAHAIKVTLGY